MKNLILCLFLFLLSLNIFSQDSVYISPELKPLVEEYILEAEERCIDVREHINQMSYIAIDTSMQFPLLGLASRDGKFVFIGAYCILDRTVLKIVLFHELTHSIFKIGHTNRSQYDIMRDRSPESFRIYDDIPFLEERLDELFKN